MKTPSRFIRILVADDHEFVRAGLISVIQDSHPEWKVVGEASDGQQALEMAALLQPDLAIVDLSMPGVNGLKVTSQLCASIPGIRVLVLSVHMALPVMRQLRRAGANAFLSKSDAPTLLVSALERVLAGASFFASDSAFRPPSQLDPEERVPVQYLLTPREIDVLRLLAVGRSNKEVAADLALSVRTAESHRADIQDRLATDSLGELVRLAVQDGVV